MRPGRYEILLWALTIVLLIGPFVGLTLLFAESSSNQRSPDVCFVLAEKVDCPPTYPGGLAYWTLAQLVPSLVIVGAVLVGICLATRAIIVTRAAPASEETKQAEPGEHAAPPSTRVWDHDLFRRPQSGPD